MSEFVPLDGQLCYSLYSAAISVNRAFKPLLDAVGITYPQYLVLCTLWEGDGRAISAIAERVALEPSTITPLVQRLEAKGFVTRRRCSRDERLVEVFLTAKGEELKTLSGRLRATLAERSGISVGGLLALNKEVRALLTALTNGRAAAKL
jgi:MarR family transcriptional regulator, organic hydroperoxide resistance regulator